ncbi:MAG: VanW family protein [Chloroflexota bacterium]|nr:VanW family protein [Chloroflexota bacterium]
MRRESKQRWRRYVIRSLLTVWFCFFMVLSLGGLVVLYYGARYSERIYEGVTIQGVDVGGFLPQEALGLLEKRLSEASPYICLYTAEQEWTFSSGHLGGCRDLAAAVDEAWRLGREGVFHEDMKTRLRLLWQGYDIVPAYHVEDGPALLALRQVARQAGRPVQQARLRVAGLQAHTDAPEVGREVDIEATRQRIEAAVQEAMGASSWKEGSPLAHLRPDQRRSTGDVTMEAVRVPLAFQEIVPPLTEVEGAREKVATFLGEPLILHFAFPELSQQEEPYVVHKRWAVDRAVLASWLTSSVTSAGEGLSVQIAIDREAIRLFLRQIADDMARPPREGRYDYDPQEQQLTVLAPAQNGYALDVEAAQDRVAAACLSPQREVSLPVYVIRPHVTRADLEELLPLDLISKGQSSFEGSRPGRLQNIRVATARFHGVTVPSQATFSFLDHLGLVTVANGYTQSWIIYGDRTVLGPGGGVCQVSTTCFRAAFWGGYPIVERHPHAYRVSWYEPPVGLDAAAFNPSVDMRFRNDSPTPILVLTEVNEEDAMLTFEFYGKKGERSVRMEGPVTSNPVEPGDPIVEEDPSLPPGQRRQVEWPHTGLDVTIYRIIEQKGGEAIKERFFSRYEPWPARYLIGPQKTEEGNDE